MSGAFEVQDVYGRKIDFLRCLTLKERDLENKIFINDDFQLREKQR